TASFTACGEAISRSSSKPPAKAISSPTPIPSATLAPSPTEPPFGDCSTKMGEKISVGKDTSTIQVSCPKGKYTMHIGSLQGDNPPSVTVNTCAQFDEFSLPGQSVSKSGEVKTITVVE